MSRQLQVVFIEDSPDLLESWKDLLELDGHHFTGFLRGADALNAQGAISTADVLVTDYYLPDINGAELVKRLRADQPDLAVIFVTGSKESNVIDDVRSIPNATLLHKPLRAGEMEQALFSAASPSRPTVM